MSEVLADRGKEKTAPPPFRATFMDEAWAFDYAQYVKKTLDDPQYANYRKYLYPKEFRPYLRDNRDTVTDEAFKAQLHAFYETWDPSSQLDILKKCEETFNRGIARYLPLQKWGFEIPDEYNIVVTPFAIGGGGAGLDLPGRGKTITMYYDRKWDPTDRKPEETLLHEAYHLGVDDIIERELGPAFPNRTEYQEMKERTVDFCVAETLVPDVLPTYVFQFNGENFHVQPEHPITDILRQTKYTVPERLSWFARSLRVYHR